MKNIIKRIIKRLFAQPSIELAVLWPIRLNISVMKKLNGIQLTAEQLSAIAISVKDQAPCKLLVFGLGNDSLFWLRLNRGGVTIFLEEDDNWFHQITQKSKEVRAFPVKYNTKISDWNMLLDDQSLLDMTLPIEVTNEKWDIIIVDAPGGWNDQTSGRMKSIYHSSRLIKKSGDVFIHDCNREIEDVYCNKFLKKENLKIEIKAPVGFLRHYHITGSVMNVSKGRIIELNNNGAWSWFMDERVVVHNGKLLVGSIRSTDKSYRSGMNEPHWGNCEVAVYDLVSGETNVVVLYKHFEQDDHDGPAFFIRPDGRVLAVYSKHSLERRVFWRISESDDLLQWSPIQEIETPGEDHPPFGGDNVTYSNLMQLSAENGRLYNFFRSVAHQQNYMFSDDAGESWRYGGMFLCGYSGYAPYFKYATDGVGTIHFIGTEDHPRKFDNSVYHGFVKDGKIHQSDGVLVRPLSTTEEKSGDIWELTPLFQGDADNVPWVIDLHLDKQGHPVCVFSVQKDGRGLPPGQGGFDHRYHYARWDGTQWIEYEIAYAGTRLYPGEDDYTGLAAIDPQETNTVYISTDAHPTSGESLISNADGQRHHEIFQGITHDGGATWDWVTVTQDSAEDNLRPIVPTWKDPHVALVWMRGKYCHNRGPWSTRVVALIQKRLK